MILCAIKYKNKFFSEFEEVNIKNGYGGHGIGFGSWKEFKPIFTNEHKYFTKRSIGNNVALIIKAMQEGLISQENLKLIIKND